MVMFGLKLRLQERKGSDNKQQKVMRTKTNEKKLPITNVKKFSSRESHPHGAIYVPGFSEVPNKGEDVDEREIWDFVQNTLSTTQ